MPAPVEPPTLAQLLRRAGYDLPPATIAELQRAHELLQAMLARLNAGAPESEPATTFRPDAPR